MFQKVIWMKETESYNGTPDLTLPATAAGAYYNTVSYLTQILSQIVLFSVSLYFAAGYR